MPASRCIFSTSRIAASSIAVELGVVDLAVQAIDASPAQFFGTNEAAAMVGAEDWLCHEDEPCFDCETKIRRGLDLIDAAAPGQRSPMLGRRAARSGRTVMASRVARDHSQPPNHPSARPFRRIRSDGARDRARAGVRSAVRPDQGDPAHAARWAGRHVGPLDRRSRRRRDRAQLRHGAARRRRRADRRRIRRARRARRQHAAVRHRRPHHAARPLRQAPSSSTR